MAKRSSDNSPWKPSKQKVQKVASNKPPTAPDLPAPQARDAEASLKETLDQLAQAIVEGPADRPPDGTDKLINELPGLLDPPSTPSQTTPPPTNPPESLEAPQIDGDSAAMPVGVTDQDAAEPSVPPSEPLPLDGADERAAKEKAERLDSAEDFRQEAEQRGISIGAARDELADIFQGQRDMTPRERREAAEQRRDEREEQRERDAEEAESLNMTVGRLKDQRRRQAAAQEQQDQEPPASPPPSEQDAGEQDIFDFDVPEPSSVSEEDAPAIKDDGEDYSQLNESIERGNYVNEDQPSPQDGGSDNELLPEPSITGSAQASEGGDMSAVVALLATIASDLAEIKTSVEEMNSGSSDYHG